MTLIFCRSTRTIKQKDISSDRTLESCCELEDSILVAYHQTYETEQLHLRLVSPSCLVAVCYVHELTKFDCSDDQSPVHAHSSSACSRQSSSTELYICTTMPRSGFITHTASESVSFMQLRGSLDKTYEDITGWEGGQTELLKQFYVVVC